MSTSQQSDTASKVRVKCREQDNRATRIPAFQSRNFLLWSPDRISAQRKHNSQLKLPTSLQKRINNKDKIVDYDAYISSPILLIPVKHISSHWPF